VRTLACRQLVWVVLSIRASRAHPVVTGQPEAVNRGSGTRGGRVPPVSGPTERLRTRPLRPQGRRGRRLDAPRTSLARSLRPASGRSAPTGSNYAAEGRVHDRVPFIALTMSPPMLAATRAHSVSPVTTPSPQPTPTTAKTAAVSLRAPACCVARFDIAAANWRPLAPKASAFDFRRSHRPL
jgi:hypothetical protein